MNTIPVDSQFALVDDEDYVRLAAHRWHLQHGYAARKILTINGKKTTRYMHAEVLRVAKGRRVDHINLTRLDNRRANLRDITHAENIMHRERTIREEFSSRFRGVAFHRVTRTGPRYIVQYKKSYLGVTKTEEDGAALYDLAALLDLGIDAQLNFPIQCRASDGGGLSAAS